MDIVTQKVIERVQALFAQGVQLQARKDATERLELPISATCQFALTFTLLELREAGVTVTVLTPDGRPMTDDEYAAALLHTMERQSE